ncbi:hypothetical protein ACLMJK_009605 [Lecanora helva]
MGINMAEHKDWSGTLEVQRLSIRFDIDLGIFESGNMQRALAAKDTYNPALALAAQGASSAVEDKIRQLNVDAASGEKPDQNTWMDSLETKKEELKIKSTIAIDQSFAAAVAYILGLPPNQQKPAATLFSTGADAIKDVIGQISNFLRGIWAGIQTAYNAVKAAVAGAIGRIRGLFSMPLQAPAGLPQESGLFEGTIVWRDKGSVVEAAALADLLPPALDAVIDCVDDQKPVYSVLSTFVNRRDDGRTAGLLFRVSENASKLGQHLKGTLKKHGVDTNVTWSARSESGQPMNVLMKYSKWLTRGTMEIQSEAQASAGACLFSLTWWKKGGQALQESVVENSLNVLQNAISEATKNKYIVYTGPLEKTSKLWTAEIACQNVLKGEIPQALAAMKKVLEVAAGKKPNSFTYERLDA